MSKPYYMTSTEVAIARELGLTPLEYVRAKIASQNASRMTVDPASGVDRRLSVVGKMGFGGGRT